MKSDHVTPAEFAHEADMVAAAQRDPSQFGLLYERYVDQIYRYAYRRVGNHADAEDVTAQTFQQALAAIPSYEWRGLPFGAWLYRIASNILSRRGRTSSREIAVEDVSIYARKSDFLGDDPADLMSRNADSDALVEAIRLLPLDQQRAVVLKFSRGLKNREIGETLGRSEGAVKQLVHRAMLSLRSLLESSNES